MYRNKTPNRKKIMIIFVAICLVFHSYGEARVFDDILLRVLRTEG